MAPLDTTDEGLSLVEVDLGREAVGTVAVDGRQASFGCWNGIGRGARPRPIIAVLSGTANSN